MKNSTKIILAVLGLAIIAAGFYFYYDYYLTRVNYLIPGVPYFGVFNHFFDGDSLVATSVADVLGYWGDERFALTDLMASFPRGEVFTILDIDAFFKANGYETYRWLSNEPGKEIGEIKKFVNPEKKVPTIVFQKRFNDAARTAKGYRVVIGVFDNQRKIIVHDHDFGNNYEIAYRDFEALFGENSRAMLAVWPSEELKQKIKGPDYSRVYSERWPEMEAIGRLLMKGADSMAFYSQGDKVKAAQIHQEMVGDENFKYFPPAHQVFVLGFDVALRLEIAGKDVTALDAVTQFIKNIILPINNNLSQPYKNWTEQVGYFKNRGYNEDKFAKPFYLLGMTYLRQGNEEAAISNFEEALKIYPQQKDTLRELEKLKAK